MNTTARHVVFFATSVGMIYVSRTALRNPRSHGFYRFLVFEPILGLFFLNVNDWFVNPFSWNQLVSWSLLCISIVPLVLGIRDLRKLGNPVENQEGEPQLLAKEIIAWS